MKQIITNLDADDAIITIKVREIKDEPGKPIYLTFKDKEYQLLTDVRCLGNTDEDNICKPCKLKFRCFTSDGLRVNVENDLANIPFQQEPTISDLIKMFLAKNGVDLTKCEARAKILEDEAKKHESDEPEALAMIKKMMAGGFRNQLRCPSCGHIFDFDYMKDTGEYECPSCGHKWSK